MNYDNPFRTNLVGDWRFDPATGLMLPDWSGRGNHGVFPGGASNPTWQITDIGPALYFNGDYVTVKTNGISQSDFTFECFVYLVSNVNNAPFIVVETATYTALRMDAAQHANLILNYAAGGWGQVSTISTLSLNTWYHIVGTFNDAADSIAIYLNGKYENSAATTQVPTGTNVRLGYSTVHSHSSDMKMANARIYNRALTQPEVSLLYQQVLQRGQPDRRMWFVPYPIRPAVVEEEEEEEAVGFFERGILRGIIRGLLRGV